MEPPSPVASYTVGVASIGLGLHCVVFPKKEYPRFGLPLESPTSTPTLSNKKSVDGPNVGVASPLIYLKGIREITYGIALIALQYRGNDAGVTIFSAVLSLAGLGDGLVVWLFGGERLRSKAWGHLGAFVGLAGWAWWRARRGFY